jgi:hypothetical protein
MRLRDDKQNEMESISCAFMYEKVTPTFSKKLNSSVKMSQ